MAMRKRSVKKGKKAGGRKKTPVKPKAAGKPRRTQKLPAKASVITTHDAKLAAAAVCQALTDSGFDPVLTGRACASVYANHSIKVEAMDFVVSEYIVDEIRSKMKSLGFACKVHRTFGSKECPFEVSFLPPPVVVGDAVVDELNTIKTSKGTLRLLNPTDCVRQRLSTYYRFGNRHALDDAVIVAKKFKVDMDLIERWSHWEWASDKFEVFKGMLDGVVRTD
jgi:hypothetical protein